AIVHKGPIIGRIILPHKPLTLPALKNTVREVLDSEPLPRDVITSARTFEPDKTKDVGEGTFAFRAKRFNLQIPLRFRPLDQQGWLKGTTENISRSGLLFRSEELLQLNAHLEINLVLPVEIAGLTATVAFFRAVLVRLF